MAILKSLHGVLQGAPQGGDKLTSLSQALQTFYSKRGKHPLLQPRRGHPIKHRLIAAILRAISTLIVNELFWRFEVAISLAFCHILGSDFDYSDCKLLRLGFCDWGGHVRDCEAEAMHLTV